MTNRFAYLMEFHISRKCRDYYEFDDSIFSFNGNVVFESFLASRLFAKKMNDRLEIQEYPERAIKASQINAMGLIDEILHIVVEIYRQQLKPEVMGDLLESLQKKFGAEKIDRTLRIFLEEFPPLAVYQGISNTEEYLSGESFREVDKIVPNREILLEEMLLLWLANLNPAFSPFKELFDDESMSKNSIYREIMNFSVDYFDDQPFFGPDNQNLIEMLRSPVKASPHSLSGQLDYISSRWGYLLGSLLYRLLDQLLG